MRLITHPAMTIEFNPKFPSDQGKKERTRNIVFFIPKKSYSFFFNFPKNKTVINKHRPQEEFLST